MPTTKKKKRVLVVDDHPMMRRGLAQLINHESDLIVCGQAEDASQAMSAIAQAQPDLVLADLSLPGKNGLELIKDLQPLYPALPVLVFSMHDESLWAERVLRAGGRGYIMKHEGGKLLMTAIRQVLSGQIYVSPKMSAKILELFSGNRPATAGSPLAQLTDREFEVFQLLGQGKGTREIAEHLHLSVKTVEVHRGHIKQKLNVKTPGELIRLAVRSIEAQNGIQEVRPQK